MPTQDAHGRRSAGAFSTFAPGARPASAQENKFKWLERDFRATFWKDPPVRIPLWGTVRDRDVLFRGNHLSANERLAKRQHSSEPGGSRPSVSLLLYSPSHGRGILKGVPRKGYFKVTLKWRKSDLKVTSWKLLFGDLTVGAPFSVPLLWDGDTYVPPSPFLLPDAPPTGSSPW